MPTKFKPSEVRVDRESKTKTNVHYYMKAQSEKTLRGELARDHATPKQKDKVRKELVRRGLPA